MTEQENIVTLTQTKGIATLIARLRKEESRCASVYIIDAAIETIERLVNERNEARYMFCHLASKLGRSETDIADVLDWDCYKKEETK